MGKDLATDVNQVVTWRPGALTLEIDFGAEAAPSLRSVSARGKRLVFDGSVASVQVLAAGFGHSQANSRLIQTSIGNDFRYDHHTIRPAQGKAAESLEVVMTARESGLRATLCLSSFPGAAAIRSSVTLENLGTETVAIQSVTSWASGFGAPEGTAPSFPEWHLLEGKSDWLAEGRWTSAPLRSDNFPVINQELTGHEPRGSHSVVSKGSWSTGASLPVGGLSSDELGFAWIWQVENNGAWRWEVGENSGDGYIALSGPTELDHDWSVSLGPGETFKSIPVAVAIGADITEAVAELTAYRRADRRDHVDNSAMPVVFNDYMNTLNGDPTTEKLIPLVDAAANAGAEVFCIDAGWYDDGGDWWDSVGEWLPSTVRFPGGLEEVIERIRSSGMMPGLWLEPEVVGVRSRAADELPQDAFFQRRGTRITEHDRYHLDLRHPAAVAHLDAVVDRLVQSFGIGFFKFDYNINPGAGTDVGCDSLGGGLLGHNRAHLDWLDSLAKRHPNLIIENCASGAMRADWAILSRMQLQSTSDQQDFRLYPPIAAAAPLSMLPEQAASWAYPQPEMSEEHVAYCLATGLLGRFYVSGYLNRMSDSQLGLVREAIATAKTLRNRITRSTPVWPLGIPRWDDPWVSMGLAEGETRLITLWKRTLGSDSVVLSFPELIGADYVATTIFPSSLSEWQTTWDASTGTLHVLAQAGSESARTIELRPHATQHEEFNPKTERPSGTFKA